MSENLSWWVNGTSSDVSIRIQPSEPVYSKAVASLRSGGNGPKSTDHAYELAVMEDDNEWQTRSLTVSELDTLKCVLDHIFPTSSDWN